MFQAGKAPDAGTDPLHGYAPSNVASPALYPHLLAPVRSQASVTPLAVRLASKVQPVFSTLQLPLKPPPMPANNSAYNPMGAPFAPSSSVVPRLPSASTALPLATLASAVGAANVPVRDSTWLKMRVCPAFLKEMIAGESLPDAEKCSFTEETCSFAHPQPNVRIENENVTVCFDFIKRNECRHINCKYYHPPKHHIEAVLKRGDITKKHSAGQGAQAATTSLAGLCWPGGSVTQSPILLNPAAQTNPAMTLAMLAAMRGPGTSGTALYSPNAAAAAAAAASMYLGFPEPANIAPFLSSYYALPTTASVSPSSALAANAYNTAELLSGGAPTTSPFFSPGGPVNSAAYAAAMAAVSASRQAATAAAAIPPPPPPPTSAARSGDALAGPASGRKREAPGDKDSQTNMPTKRIHTMAEDMTNGASVVNHVAPVSNASQLASSLVLNTWLQQQQQQQQQQHQQQLSSPPPASLPTAASPTVALQAAALMRLQQQQQQQQQQQHQQQWAAVTAGYGPLAGLAPNSAAAAAAAVAAAAYSNSAAFFDPLAFQSAGLTANPYAANMLHNQTLLTNVAYINDDGQLLESLPICRDFKAGKCNRNTECRYVHLIDENVEVNQSRVTVCRDAAKGRCTRIPCKYYHIPLLAISASRSLALNSALSAAVAANAFNNAVTAASVSATTPGTAVTTSASSPTGGCNAPPPSTSASL